MSVYFSTINLKSMVCVYNVGLCILQLPNQNWLCAKSFCIMCLCYSCHIHWYLGGLTVLPTFACLFTWNTFCLATCFTIFRSFWTFIRFFSVGTNKNIKIGNVTAVGWYLPIKKVSTCILVWIGKIIVVVWLKLQKRKSSLLKEDSEKKPSLY